MSSEGIFTGMDAAVMNGLNSVIQGQMSLYSTMMAGLVTGSATLYILWRGYQTLAGKLHTPVEDVAWDLARMGIILAFVTNADGYLDASVAAINGLKDGLSGSENVWVLRGLRANDAKNHANSVSSLFILKLIGTAFTATSVVMVGLRDGSAWKKEIILL